VASVSHEVRTPLTAVVGLAAAFEEGWQDLPDEDQRELVRLISQQSREVSDIIDDLLVASRAGSGSIVVSPVPMDLGTQVEQVLHMLEHRGKTISLTGSARALADPRRVRQVVRNLVTNAIRYGGTHIEIRISSSEGRASVEVSDDGPVIPDELAARMFDAYQRAGRGAPGTESVGLGLHISRELSELMNGDLRYRRTADHNTFILRLPAGS
jgi:signal transduction histidine kinase